MWFYAERCEKPWIAFVSTTQWKLCTKFYEYRAHYTIDGTQDEIKNMGPLAQNSSSQQRRHHSERGLAYLSTGCMCMNPCMHSEHLEVWLFILYRWATERQVPQSQSFLSRHLPVGHHSLERASCPNNISSQKKKNWPWYWSSGQYEFDMSEPFQLPATRCLWKFIAGY